MSVGLKGGDTTQSTAAESVEVHFDPRSLLSGTLKGDIPCTYGNGFSEVHGCDVCADPFDQFDKFGFRLVLSEEDFISNSHPINQACWVLVENTIHIRELSIQSRRVGVDPYSHEYCHIDLEILNCSQDHFRLIAVCPVQSNLFRELRQDGNVGSDIGLNGPAARILSIQRRIIHSIENQLQL